MQPNKDRKLCSLSSDHQVEAKLALHVCAPHRSMKQLKREIKAAMAEKEKERGEVKGLESDDDEMGEAPYSQVGGGPVSPGSHSSARDQAAKACPVKEQLYVTRRHLVPDAACLCTPRSLARGLPSMRANSRQTP